MSILGSDTIPFWGLALLLITASATAIAVSALWPPIHYRRFVTVAAFALVALSCVFVDRIPNVRLPMQVVVVAECGVLDRPGFRTDMQNLGEEPVLFREVGLRVLATGSGDPCPVTPPEFPGLEVSFERVPPDREASLERAREYLDANRPRHWAAWPRSLAGEPRIVLAHAPAGPLAPPSSPKPLKPLPDGREPVLYEKSYGSVSFRSVRITVTPAAITEEDRSRGIMIELADPRLGDATRLDVAFNYRTVGPVPGACAVEATHISRRTISLSGGGVPITPRAYDFAHLDVAPGVGLPRLDVFLKDPFPISGCGGRKAWLALDIEFNVALAAGGAIGDRRTIMVPILPTTGLTLVTPNPAGRPNAKAQRVAARGWEHDANSPGFGFDGGPGITSLLETLFATLRPEACGGSGCTAISPSFLQRTRPCWFRGVADTIARPREFHDCLARTRRLVVVGIEAPRLLELDGRFGIEAAVLAGNVDVMVAAPVHDADRTDLPGWVPKMVPGPTLRTEPRVHLLVSTRDTLRMKTSTGRSGLAAQKAFVDAVASSGLIGPSGEQPARGVPPRQGLCVRGELFPEGGGLAWFAHTRVPRQPPDMMVFRPSAAPKPELRLKGAFLSHRFDSPAPEIVRQTGAYAANVVCNSPVRRLDLALSAMQDRGEFQPGTTDIPRAVLVVFAEDDKHVGLRGLVDFDGNSSCAEPPTEAAQFRTRLSQFAAAGGTVLILPVADRAEIDADERVLKAATKEPIVDLRTLVEQLRDIAGTPDSVHLLPTVLNSATAEANVVNAFNRFLASRWETERRLVGAFIGDGALSDRRDVCAADPLPSTGNWMPIGRACAFTQGDSWASALNRLTASPEQTRLLAPSEDPFVTGRWQLCTGEEIAHARPHGLGRVSALGFSPFARDLLTADLSPPTTGTLSVAAHDALLRRGQCYLQADGRRADTIPFNTRFALQPPESLPIETRGGLKLLEHFARFSSIDRPVGAPRVHSITVDPGTGNLEVAAVADLTSDWVWEPRAMLPNGDTDKVPVRFVAFDRRTGIARFVVSSRDPFAGLLQLWLYRPLPAAGGGTGTAAVSDPVLLPVNFKGEAAVAASAMRRAPFYHAPNLLFDGSTIAIVGMLAATLLMFSPLARRWRAAEELARSVLGTSPRDDPFERTARAAPLFSLQAGLAEWGLHPGNPAAIRAFGLPAGLRRWRSGDQGGAIRIATLYSLVAREPSLPLRLPEVKLRTASEAADVLVLVEGNGAFLTPRARRAPGKAVFAARFSAFLAHAVRLSHGVAAILRVGLEPLEHLEPEDTENALLASLEARPSHVPPSEALGEQSLSGRLVYYVCDGLSINARHLVALADELVAEGSQLRIAAIVSRDDADNIGLRRDSLDGAFDDDTETPPGLIVARRDALLEDIAVALSRRQASLVTLDSSLDTQSLLERMSETGFLQ